MLSSAKQSRPKCYKSSPTSSNGKNNHNPDHNKKRPKILIDFGLFPIVFHPIERLRVCLIRNVKHPLNLPVVSIFSDIFVDREIIGKIIVKIKVVVGLFDRLYGLRGFRLAVTAAVTLVGSLESLHDFSF